MFLLLAFHFSWCLSNFLCLLCLCLCRSSHPAKCSQFLACLVWVWGGKSKIVPSGAGTSLYSCILCLLIFVSFALCFLILSSACFLPVFVSSSLCQMFPISRVCVWGVKSKIVPSGASAPGLGLLPVRGGQGGNLPASCRQVPHHCSSISTSCSPTLVLSYHHPGLLHCP